MGTCFCKGTIIGNTIQGYTKRMCSILHREQHIARSRLVNAARTGAEKINPIVVYIIITICTVHRCRKVIIVAEIIVPGYGSKQQTRHTAAIDKLRSNTNVVANKGKAGIVQLAGTTGIMRNSIPGHGVA